MSKRSDVFIADRFLKSLETDYCKDLLIDSADALRWLDENDRTLSRDVKKSIKCFTFDFKALYDSLKPELVIEAVQYAMDSCRPSWSNDFKHWIISLISFSLKSSVAKYNDSWWRQKNGLPTGGSLCVQLANIAIFYVISREVYEIPDMMVNIGEVRRFIDDEWSRFLPRK